jgi:hypothetical protein
MEGVRVMTGEGLARSAFAFVVAAAMASMRAGFCPEEEPPITLMIWDCPP